MDTNPAFRELKEQLKFKDFELNSILEITKGINDNKPIDYLCSIYEYILRDRLRLEKFALFMKQEKWNCLVKSGVKGKIKNIDAAEVSIHFQQITLIESSSIQELDEFNVIIPVIHQEKPIAFLLLKENQESKHANITSSFNNRSFIQTITNILVVAIENKRMYKLGLAQERIKKELEVASEMQKLLFPERLPSDRRFDLAANYIARHEVGGDYYDFIPINNHEFFICIGDVSGKGVGAAMLMANFQAVVRTYLDFNKHDLKTLIPELNQKVINVAQGEKFITFFIGHYNAKTRYLKYVNAGHNHPILTNGKKAQLLDKGSVGLGMMEDLPFVEPGIIQVESNSTLILYTDGVVEAQNKGGEYFKTDLLIKIIHRFYPLKMEDLNNIIFSKLDEFRGKEELVDDIAIFSCRIF